METFLKKPLLITAGASAAFLAAAGIALVFHWNNFPSRVVLHFEPVKGADLFGTRGDVLTLWTLGIAVAVMNAFLAKVFYDRSRELSYLFGSANALISLILLIAIGTIISVN